MEFHYWNTVEAVVLEGMIGDGVLFESQRTRIHRVGPKLQGHDWCIHHDSRRRCGGYSMSSVFWYFMCVGSEESQKKDSYSWWSKEFISFYINLAVFNPQRNPNRVQSIPAVAFGVSIFVPGTRVMAKGGDGKDVYRSYRSIRYLYRYTMQRRHRLYTV